MALGDRQMGQVQALVREGETQDCAVLSRSVALQHAFPFVDALSNGSGGFKAGVREGGTAGDVS